MSVELRIKEAKGNQRVICGDPIDTIEDAKILARECAEIGKLFIDDHGVMGFVISGDGFEEFDFSVEVATGESWSV